MLLVMLTQQPEKECKSTERRLLLDQLAAHKEAFLAPKVISTLMGHLADCLQQEQKNHKHYQMIELIIVLFK